MISPIEYKRLCEIQSVFQPVKSDSAVAKCAYIEQRLGRASVKPVSKTAIKIELNLVGKSLISQYEAAHER